MTIKYFGRLAYDLPIPKEHSTSDSYMCYAEVLKHCKLFNCKLTLKLLEAGSSSVNVKMKEISEG